MSKKQALNVVLAALGELGPDCLCDFMDRSDVNDVYFASNLLQTFADRCDDDLVLKPLSKKEALRVLVNFANGAIHNTTNMVGLNSVLQDDIYEAIEAMRDHADVCDPMLRIS